MASDPTESPAAAAGAPETDDAAKDSETAGTGGTGTAAGGSTDTQGAAPGGVDASGQVAAAATDGVPATRGVPIVPGVPFLPEAEPGSADPDAQENPGGPVSAGQGSAGVTDAAATPAGEGVPQDVTALMGDAATAPSGVHLNAYAVPVSAVPPSALQGPTLTVPAPLPPGTGNATAIGTATGTATADDPGWRPSGSVGSASPRTNPSPRDDVPTATERSRREKDRGPEPASALTADRLLVGTDRAPVSGWRRWLYTVTFGRMNVGDSVAVREQRSLEHRISVRLGGRTRYVPVLSRKGGVGKTTVTTLLGMALADIREDRIIAMDANPDRGTLSDRSPGRADHTARQLVQNRYSIESFAQLAGYVTRDGSRLHVLASDTDPTVAQAFDDADYRAVTDLLSRYYSIVLTDSGTGMVHSVMKGTLEKADSVVLVSGGSVDEARLASETLSWLEAHGRQDLVAKAIVVINLSSGNGTQVDVSQIEQHFRSRVSTVVRIPYDRHLAEGSRVDLAKLNPATRRAVTELAALVVDQLAD